MAYQIPILDISFPAGEDLTEKQFKFVELNSDSEITEATAGDLALGVLQNDPDEDEAGGVRVAGVSKVVAGETIAPNNLVEVGTDGKAEVQATGDGVGICLEGGDADEVITILVIHMPDLT